MAEIRHLNRRKFLAVFAAATSLPLSSWARDARWAQPISLEGVPNLNQVGPNLYRSAQPTAAGFIAAEKKLKLRTVISLRGYHSDADLLKGTSIERASVPMSAWNITNDEIISALKQIKSAQAKGPVLLHCLHGADRTGVVVAMYRILYQGWSKEQALDEMKNGGFNFHSVWANIPTFVKNADIAAFKQALAIRP
jgi:protein tyrosine/serine phosphatase